MVGSSQMTFTPKVWGDALRRLQNQIPEFTFDAWIAPLTVKISADRLILGCPTSFHRDRVRLRHLETIERCWQPACEAAGTTKPAPIELLTRSEFARAAGEIIETSVIRAAVHEKRASMRKVGAESKALAVNDRGNRNALGTGQNSPIARSGPHTDAAFARESPASNSGVDGATIRSNPHALQIVPSEATPKPAARIGNDSREAKGDFASSIPLRSLESTESGRARGAGSESGGGSALAFGLEGAASRKDLPFGFDSFIVGPCNALAREAAMALAQRRQQSLNQLYLGGGSGMGKTHLARATADEARFQAVGTPTPNAAFPFGSRGQASRDPRGAARVIYTSAEQFTSDFVSAMRNGRNEAWTKRYRGPIDLFVIEDIHFLVGRTKTQLELYHTIEHVLDSGGRVLMTGDRAPRDLTGLDERMRTLVARGFVAELDCPDALVRRHILRAKATAGGIHLPADCLDLLVGSSAGSVRDVEGVLIQVVTTASLLGRSIDLALTREAINLKSGASSALAPRKLDVREVVQIVATFFGMRPEALATRSRRRAVLVPRQLAMYLAHRYTEASLTEIGCGLGRDHPSVRNAITRIERQVVENAPLRYQVEALSERIDQSLEDRA
ncbi:MAG: hypothetical protein CL933_05845 [Deltaproteobacteria bacterium]|nr:hypothetical protein [Deltaproteobacteria bacterium]